MEGGVNLKKIYIFKFMSLIILSALLIYFVVYNSNNMGLSIITVGGIWSIIFVVILLLFRWRLHFSLLTTLYSIVISLMILISLPIILSLIHLMNAGQK